MSLYKQWQDLIGNQTKGTYEKFWEEYSAAEIKIYKDILSHPGDAVSGSFQELTEKYQVSDVLFMGFLDGVNSSLTEPMEEKALDGIVQESALNFQIDLEKLYFNMQQAKADHLYTLPEWEDVLSGEKREEITREYKKTRTVVKGPQTGRNEPCPCGSGKKYKKCCMNRTEA